MERYNDRLWNQSLQIYTKAQNVIVLRGCNGFQVTNVGDSIVYVNDAILYPGVIGTSLGDSRTFGGNRDELYRGNINIRFGAGANPAAEVIQKFYIDKEQ